MVALLYCINISPHAVLHRFAWGIAGGFVTGNQCFVKDALTVLKLSEDKRPWKLPWTFYILVVLAIATAVSGLTILTQCMKRYDVTFSNAMNSGAMVVSGNIMSAVHYRTFSNLSSKYSPTMYPTGITIVLVGIWILVRHTKEKAVQEEDDEDTIAELRGLTEAPSLELTPVDETSSIEETAGLMSRGRRDRTASSSSIEDNYGLVRRPTTPGVSSRERTASASSVNRDRTASTEITAVNEFAIEETAGLMSPRGRGSASKPRDRTASSSSIEDNYGLVRRPSTQSTLERTASAPSANRDRTASTPSLQL